MDYTEIERYVASRVSARRLVHCRCTAVQTQWLIERYAYTAADIQAALCIGLWHDIARQWGAQELLNYCLEHGIALEHEEEKQPMLLHGAVAASLLGEHVPQATQAWKAAIRWHTLGSTAMGRLGAALYIADYLEPSRTHLTLTQREMLLEHPSLEAICLAIIERKEEYLQSKGISLAHSSLQLRDYLRNGGVL